MSPSIYAVRADGTLTQMDSQEYDSEDVLQRLLAEHPEILSGEQSESVAPKRWLLVTREAPIPIEEGGNGWFAVDHLFLDQEGVPTFVEVKRATDTRTRREVVGQMLDYAANAVAYWPADAIRASLERHCAEAEQDAETVLTDAFGGDTGYADYWERVKTNLLAKRIRLMFVADRLPAELRRIVEFLNEVTDPLEVLALEVSQFVGHDQRVLVPRIYGQTQDAAQRKRPPSGPKTTRDAFLASWDARGQAYFERLFTLAEAEGLHIAWGGKGFTVRVPVDGRPVTLMESYPPEIYNGQHYVPIGRIADSIQEGEAIAVSLADALASLPGTDTASGRFRRVIVKSLSESDERALFEALRVAARQMTRSGFRPKA